MSSGIPLVPNCRLQMRPLQELLDDQWIQSQRSFEDWIIISPPMKKALSWWKLRENLVQGLTFEPRCHRYGMTSDASLQGWGVHLQELEIQGHWSEQEACLHINMLELKAVFLGLKDFLPRICGSTVHDTLPQVSEDPGHTINPGSWVLVKNFKRTKNDQPRWSGPYLVLLSTRSAVQVEGKKNWIHGVHCKRVPLPLPYDRLVQEGIADSETETVPRFLPFSDARVKGTNSERESDNLLQEAVPPSIRMDTTEPELLLQDQTLPGKSCYNLRPRTMDK
ncbi:uncharacterized protein LOC144785295 [Lissotriton helveticus]